ncbi:MAG: HNH endonuclease signature motif containing protein, partial [Actinomycetota bacterium]|nr:HNH endonuclease signature motif containing protein [Actinomycetota bacterium]
GEHLADGEATLIQAAVSCGFDDFVSVVTTWEQTADADGAHKSHEKAHQHRNATAGIVGEQSFLDAHGGVAAGVQIKEILDAFAQTEWHADWEAGVALHGDSMCPGLMARTDAQRRFDALLAIFLKAAGADSDTTGSGCTVNLVVGLDTLQHHLEKALGGHPAPLDPNNPLHRCETGDGVPVDPMDMLAAATTGHIRRVVLDSAGVVVDLGRRQRLFTGPLREAVLLHSRRCIWPGCHRPASQCDADHLLPWATAGPSATNNGGPMCGYHNRWKATTYRTWRDPHGHWHHYRPDGTEISWRATQPNAHAPASAATATPSSELPEGATAS